MKQIVIISGKGGTGKTTVTGALGNLADGLVLSDADVEAPDLHLILQPEIREREPFIGMSKAKIDPDRCIGCWECIETCRFDAISQDGEIAKVDDLECEGCHACGLVCHESAISFEPSRSGEIFLSSTRWGPMSHAQLTMGEETSGRIVSVVRENAKNLSKKHQEPLILIDGPPGVACPVIASTTGVDLAIIVTEPTISGLSDLERALELTKHFEVQSYVIVNKADLVPEMALKIREFCEFRGVRIIGEIPFDPTVGTAIANGRTVIEEDKDASASIALVRIWEEIKREFLQEL
ncbi:MAG: 4Fe-4S binding protein [Candidatus Thorarchaeota archaeon]